MAAGRCRSAGSPGDDAGLGTVTFAVTDEYGEVQPVINPQDAAGETSTTWRRQVTLDTALQGDDRSRDYTITATVSDVAGNVSTTSTRVLPGKVDRLTGFG